MQVCAHDEMSFSLYKVGDSTHELEDMILSETGESQDKDCTFHLLGVDGAQDTRPRDMARRHIEYFKKSGRIAEAGGPL